MSNAIKKTIAVLLVIIFAVLFDQITKFWAEDNFASLRYPDHQIEMTVQPEHAGVTLEDFVKKTNDSLSDENVLRTVASATRDNNRIFASDIVNDGDKISFGYMSRTVNPFWDYQYARNPGAAFSFLADQSEQFRRIFFGITGIVALIALGAFIGFSSWKNDKRLIITLACVMGGALGNIIDRFRLGYVIDFISWHVGEHYWPTFNIADVFVTCGIALLLIELLVHKDKNKMNDNTAKKDDVTKSANTEEKTANTEEKTAESAA